MIDAEVVLVAVSEISFAAARKSVLARLPPQPAVARDVKPISSRCRLEIVCMRHVINNLLDQAALVWSKAVRITPKYGKRLQIAGRAGWFEGISCKVHSWRRG